MPPEGPSIVVDVPADPLPPTSSPSPGLPPAAPPEVDPATGHIVLRRGILGGIVSSAAGSGEFAGLVDINEQLALVNAGVAYFAPTGIPGLWRPIPLPGVVQTGALTFRNAFAGGAPAGSSVHSVGDVVVSRNFFSFFGIPIPVDYPDALVELDQRFEFGDFGGFNTYAATPQRVSEVPNGRSSSPLQPDR